MVGKNSSTLCYQSGATPLTIQNATDWENEGCLQGFLCENNNGTALPQYCTPTSTCLIARLGGASCGAPMGVLEPFVCPEGYYCPAKNHSKTACPKNNYCPLGSYEPKPCQWPALYCANSDPNNPKTLAQKDIFVLPFAILIVVDVVVLFAIALHKIVGRHRAKQGKTRGMSDGVAKWMVKKKYTYSKLGKQGGKNQEKSQRMPGSVSNFHLDGAGDESPTKRPEMKPRITSVLRRTTTGFDAMMEAGLTVEDVMERSEDYADSETTDLQLFVQSMSRCLGATKFGLSFDFENLSFQPKGSPKKILDQVSGCINAGSLWGVMGASGAGKSTFVNVLMGKQKHTGGITKVNGVPGSISQYKKIIGYVPQDDIVLAELTVRENILHSARIRLPASWTDAEIQAHVDILISCLQLSHVKNSLVGSTAAPVISGGQRKRVSIGMELAAAPMALFLDEPTSGLDATSAASIMMTLKALSRMGITIITIIHQPRQEIWESLDSLLLLGAGRLIYHGATNNVVNYFERECGFEFPPHGNPADAVMDIIAGQGHHYKKTGDTSIGGLIDNWSQRSKLLGTASNHDSILDLKQSLDLKKTIKDRGAPFYQQIWFCCCRSWVQQWRLRSSLFFELAVGALAGSLIGLAYSTSNGNNFGGLFHHPYESLSSAVKYGSIPQMALLVGVAIGLTASAPGVRIFGEEKLVYWREAASGHNRFAYYLGKVLSTLPRMALANVHFTTLFMLLSTPTISWGTAFLANQLYFYCIYGLASCVSMVVRREDGPLIATITSLIVGVLNGMSPTLAKVKSWHMVWLWRTFPGTWLAEGYFDQNISPLRYLYQVDKASQSVGYDLDKFVLDMLVLVGLGTLYRIIAFLGLRFVNRDRQK